MPIRILAISDVTKWSGYKEILKKINPDITVLLGDLVSDGGAYFWSFHDSHGYWKTDSDFESERKKHERNFYKFLKYAGKVSTVLVVKGDHENDFIGAYNPNKINKIKGCLEISGRLVRIQGISFLGLGYEDVYYLRILRPLIEKFRGKVDIILTHCEMRRVPLLAEFKPKLILKGHSGLGRFLVRGVPAIFTAGSKYVKVEWTKNNVNKVEFGSVYWWGDNIDKRLRKIERWECKRRKWLKPLND